MMSVRMLLALVAVEVAQAFLAPSALQAALAKGPRVASESALSGLCMERLGSVRSSGVKAASPPTNTRLGSIRPAGVTSAPAPPKNTRLGSIRPAGVPAPTAVQQPVNRRIGSIRPAGLPSPTANTKKTAKPASTGRIGTARGTAAAPVTSRAGSARAYQTKARLGTARVSMGGAAARAGSATQRLGTARTSGLPEPSSDGEEVLVGISTPGRAVAKTSVTRVGARTSPEKKASKSA